MTVIVAAYQPHASQEHAYHRQRAKVSRAWVGQFGYQSASAARALSTVLVICVLQILYMREPPGSSLRFRLWTCKQQSIQCPGCCLHL